MLIGTRSHTIKRTLALLIAMLLAAPVSSQIYRYEDKDGNVTFSDVPPEKDSNVTVEEVELKPTNATLPPVTTAPKSKKPRDASRDGDKPNYETTITAPSDGTTIPMGPGNFAVTANVSPQLRGGESLQLLIDGTKVGDPKRSSAWQLNNVFRGEHKLVVQRLSKKGAVVHSSDPLTVYVLRPSIR